MRIEATTAANITNVLTIPIRDSHNSAAASSPALGPGTFGFLVRFICSRLHACVLIDDMHTLLLERKMIN